MDWILVKGKICGCCDRLTFALFKHFMKIESNEPIDNQQKFN